MNGAFVRSSYIVQNHASDEEERVRPMLALYPVSHSGSTAYLGCGE